jgi:NAD(P)-dependent dehydrogenase (short-subunit alcohol dehydrogenase family)
MIKAVDLQMQSYSTLLRFAGITFMQEILRSMVEKNGGQGGNIIVTGATSSTRGREGFSSFAASKTGLRAAAHSVAREFGPKVRKSLKKKGFIKVQSRADSSPTLATQNIHVSHVVVDGLIESQQAIDYLGLEKGSRFPDGSVCRKDKVIDCSSFLLSIPFSCTGFTTGRNVQNLALFSLSTQVYLDS